jgi:hypothetical protein
MLKTERAITREETSVLFCVWEAGVRNPNGAKWGLPP